MFNGGWASSQNQGEVYGDTFIARLQDYISDISKPWERDKGAKINADIM